MWNNFLAPIFRLRTIELKLIFKRCFEGNSFFMMFVHKEIIEVFSFVSATQVGKLFKAETNLQRFYLETVLLYENLSVLCWGDYWCNDYWNRNVLWKLLIVVFSQLDFSMLISNFKWKARLLFSFQLFRSLLRNRFPAYNFRSARFYWEQSI